jgi:hypothetical protein
MDDAIPELIDVAVTSKKVEINNDLKEKKEDEFKLIVSKRKRREQNKVAASTSMGEDLELEEDDEDDDELIDEDEDTLDLKEKISPIQDFTQLKKLKFPPLSGEKLMVNYFKSNWLLVINNNFDLIKLNSQNRMVKMK